MPSDGNETSLVPSPAFTTSRTPYTGEFFTAAFQVLHRFLLPSLCVTASDLFAPLSGLTCRCCKFHFMLRAAALLPFLRELHRFNMASQPATTVPATWRLAIRISPTNVATATTAPRPSPQVYMFPTKKKRVITEQLIPRRSGGNPQPAALSHQEEKQCAEKRQRQRQAEEPQRGLADNGIFHRTQDRLQADTTTITQPDMRRTAFLLCRWVAVGKPGSHQCHQQKQQGCHSADGFQFADLRHNCAPLRGLALTPGQDQNRVPGRPG